MFNIIYVFLLIIILVVGVGLLHNKIIRFTNMYEITHYFTILKDMLPHDD